MGRALADVGVVFGDPHLVAAADSCASSGRVYMWSGSFGPPVP